MVGNGIVEENERGKLRLERMQNITIGTTWQKNESVWAPASY